MAHNEQKLASLFNASGSDKTTTHKYEVGYAKILPATASALMEIGIANGNSTSAVTSLTAWEALYPDAKIVGVDVIPEKMLNRGNISSYLVDQSSAEQLDELKSNLNTTFDVIIDDGSHYFDHTKLSFEKLFDLLSDGGVYVIEDIGKQGGYAQSKSQWEAYLETLNGIKYEFIDTYPENTTDDSLLLWIKKV